MSRSRKVRMKFRRHRTLSLFDLARALSGNPPSDPIGNHLHGRFDFGEQKRGKFQVSDPPRQALRALTDQSARRRTKNQELPRPAALIDEAPKNREEIGASLDLVQADEIIPVQIEGRARDPSVSQGPRGAPDRGRRFAS